MAVRQLSKRRAAVSEIVQEVGKCIESLDPSTDVADALVAEVLAFEAHDPEYSLDHLMADLALGGKGGSPAEGGGVKLATIHRTKGLQWPHVFLIGLEQGHLPHYRSTASEEIREERRLCFVGVCRAEESLTITWIRNYKGYPKEPSPFLQELGVV